VQEALTNVVKHAGPSADVDVVLTWGDRQLEVVVADQGGQGTTRDEEGGRGLVGMRERLELVGGTLRAGPAGDGFTVVGEIPTTAARDGGGRG
jgi:signal transduction histidine kinase